MGLGVKSDVFCDAWESQFVNWPLYLVSRRLLNLCFTLGEMTEERMQEEGGSYSWEGVARCEIELVSIFFN